MERILGLDVGDVRIGVAVSDELGLTAQGREVITRDGKELAKIAALIEELGISLVVVGMPLSLSGGQGKAAEKILQFMAELQDKIGVSVKAWDERMSTVAAQRILLEGNVSRKGRRRLVDQVAAVFILQGYMDRHRPRLPVDGN